MTATYMFYGFMLIGLVGIPWCAEAMFIVHPERRIIFSTMSVLVSLIAGVIISLMLMALATYHGHHMVSVYILLLPTVFAVCCVKVGIGERRGNT